MYARPCRVVHQACATPPQLLHHPSPTNLPAVNAQHLQNGCMHLGKTDAKPQLRWWRVVGIVGWKRTMATEEDVRNQLYEPIGRLKVRLHGLMKKSLQIWSAEAIKIS